MVELVIILTISLYGNRDLSWFCLHFGTVYISHCKPETCVNAECYPLWLTTAIIFFSCSTRCSPTAAISSSSDSPVLHFCSLCVSLSGHLLFWNWKGQKKSSSYKHRAISLACSTPCPAQVKLRTVGVIWMDVPPSVFIQCRTQPLNLLVEKSNAKWLPRAKERFTDSLDTRSIVLSV